MKVIKNILVPTDFSEVADNAYRYAVAFAAPFQSDIEVLHVFRPHIDSYMNDSMMLDELRKAAGNRLQKNIDAVTTDLKLSPRLEIGFPIDTICEVAKTDNIDLIVMGTHGVHNLAEQLFGSVSANVMRQGKRDVLIVPENQTFAGIKNIAFASDLSKNEAELLAQVALFANKFGAAIHCVHVNVQDRDLYAVTEQVFEEFGQITAPSLVVTFNEINSHSVTGGINDFIADHEIDLLVMFAHHDSVWDKLFHSSITRKMALHTKIPLLVLK